MSHLEIYCILSPHQHGFRQNHSCQTQLIGLIEDIQVAMDNHQQVHALLLDFSKAFDKVPHQRLLFKLSQYGIQGNIFNWIEGWLTNRFQQVVIDGINSSPKPVLSGVPRAQY